MTFPINITIPAGGDDPADDVPLMRGNYANTVNNLAVDHVAPGVTGNGTHEQVTFLSNSALGSYSPSAAQGVGYTCPGSANNAVSQLAYQNSTASLLLSCVKAFGSVLVGPGVTLGNALNSSVVRTVGGSSTGDYTVTIQTGAVSGTSYAVLVALNSAQAGSTNQFTFGYTISSATSFRIRVAKLSNNNLADPLGFSYVVLQY